MALPIIIKAFNNILDRVIRIQGGAGSLQTIIDHHQAQLDFARVETLASPVSMADTATYAVYQRSAGSRPFFFCGGFFSWDTSNPATDAVTINLDLQVDGANWENMWNINLSAALAPLTLAVPTRSTGLVATELDNIPIGFWVMAGNSLRVTISKDAHTVTQVVSHSFGDGVPGN